MIISSTRGFATVTKLPAFSDPKNQAFQLSVPLSTAAP